MVGVDLGDFFVDGVIVHEVPSRPVAQRSSDDELPLSEIAAPVTSEVLNFFRERINDSISKHGVDVQADPQTSSPIPQWVIDHLDGKADLVEMSQDMARHLYQEQTGVNPPGLLTVAPSNFKDSPALAIMKLQKEEGVRVQETELEGHHTLSVEHLRELMLTERTRVFKAGVFYRDDEGIVRGHVSDEQVRGVADFFLGRFLGCRFAESPATTTKQFHDTARSYFDEKVANTDERLRYHTALQVELQKHSNTVRPRDFIRDYIDEEHRHQFEQTLREAKIPLETFQKDTSRLTKSELTRTKAKTERGIQLVGDTETFDEVVEAGDEVIVIHDKIVNVTS